MAAKLGLQVVAEGIERPGELHVLQRFGCDMAQGYLFSRPVKAAEFAEWRDAWLAGAADELFADRNVRRALTKAINKQELVDAVLLGLGQPAYGPYKPGTIWANTSVPRLGFSPEEARAELEAAGWVDEDGDGAGYDIESFEPDGRPRLIEVKTTNGWERTPFDISRNELAMADRRRSDWRLLRLWNFSREPQAFELHPPLDAHVLLTATSFQARFDGEL